MKKITGLMMLVCLCAAGLAQAAVITNYSAVVADAHVRGGTNSDSNFGANWGMLLRNGSTLVNAQKIYTKVNVDSILGAQEVFTNAALNIVGAANNATATMLSIYGIVDNADAWTESAVTWNNAPKNDTANGSGVLSSGTVLLGTMTLSSGVTTGAHYSFSSAALSEYLNWTAGKIAGPYGNGASSDTSATFIITSSTLNGNYTLYGKEATLAVNRPYMTYTIIPEPTTVGLFTISSAALLLVRRCLTR